MTQLLQINIAKGVHRRAGGWFRPTNEFAQRGQVRQASDATTRDHLSAAVVANLNKHPKVA